MTPPPFGTFPKKSSIMVQTGVPKNRMHTTESSDEALEDFSSDELDRTWSRYERNMLISPLSLFSWI